MPGLAKRGEQGRAGSSAGEEVVAAVLVVVAVVKEYAKEKSSMDNHGKEMSQCTYRPTLHNERKKIVLK